MHCYLELWHVDPEINTRAHSQLKGCLCVKFHDDRCKGKAIMYKNHFQLSMLWTTKSIVHILNIWGVCVWRVMMIGEKEKQHKPLIINELWPWPLDPKIDRVHRQIIGSLYVKFHNDKCKAVTCMYYIAIFGYQCVVTFDPKITWTHGWPILKTMNIYSAHFSLTSSIPLLKLWVLIFHTFHLCFDTSSWNFVCERVFINFRPSLCRQFFCGSHAPYSEFSA